MLAIASAAGADLRRYRASLEPHVLARPRREERPDESIPAPPLLKPWLRERHRSEGPRRPLVTYPWPGPLPAPVLDGPRALYSEVLPGVDLLLVAREEGGMAHSSSTRPVSCRRTRARSRTASCPAS